MYYYIALLIDIPCLFIVMSVAVWLFYPETKGRSLEEMDQVFDGPTLVYKQKRAYADHHLREVEEKGSIEEEK